jgi:hypothetical protein
VYLIHPRYKIKRVDTSINHGGIWLLDALSSSVDKEIDYTARDYRQTLSVSDHAFDGLMAMETRRVASFWGRYNITQNILKVTLTNEISSVYYDGDKVY